MMNSMKCHNCHGMGHRSANCPFSPSHRRCYTCGKAGGLFDHREGCKDAWYDLSKPVPRDTCGKQYTRELALQVLLADYEAEKKAHDAVMRRPTPTATRVSVASPIPKRSCTSTVRAETIRQRVSAPSKTFSKGKHGEINSSTKKDGPFNDTAASASITARGVEPESIHVDVAAMRSISHELVASTLVQDVRISDGSMTPEGRTFPKFEDNEVNVVAINRETTSYQPSAMSLGIRFNEANAHLSEDLPEVLLRFVFRNSPRVFIDSGTKDEFELSTTTLRMANGLRVRYNKTRLDICGLPNRDTNFSVVAPNGSFRVAIRQPCVEINEIFFLSEFGMACLARSPMMLPAPPQFVVTLIGPPEDEIRVRYRENRYLLTIENGIVRVNPFDPVI